MECAFAATKATDYFPLDTELVLYEKDSFVYFKNEEYHMFMGKFKDKRHLLVHLTNVYQTFMIGLLMPHLITDDAWNKYDGQYIELTDPSGDTWLHIHPDWYSQVIQEQKTRENQLGEYEKSLKRTLMREGHELILLYCEETEQFQIYKAAPWFQFARIIRNAVSHKDGGCLRKWPPDLAKKGVNEVSWRERTLDVSMVGKNIKFTPHEALTLFADQMNFVMTQLK